MRAEKLKVVSVNDPQIETERMTQREMLDYVETRDFEKIVPFFKPAAKPTVFSIREIPNELWSGYVEAAYSNGEKLRRCFQCGVTAVENLYQRDGSSLPTIDLPSKNGVIADEALARFRPYQIDEIGEVIRRHSFLDPRTERCFALPLMSHEHLAERRFRPAAASQNSQAPSSDAASSPAGSTPATPSTTAQPTASSADSSGSPTAATAQEKAA